MGLAVPGKQPMFREMKSGYSVEDDRSKQNTVWPRVDEAVHSESILIRRLTAVFLRRDYPGKNNAATLANLLKSRYHRQT